jgi:hypothetical protein
MKIMRTRPALYTKRLLLSDINATTIDTEANCQAPESNALIAKDNAGASAVKFRAKTNASSAKREYL